MLYDPKWEVQTKPDVYSLESLIAWLEKLPAEKTYIWAGSDCLICQYLEAHGENKFRTYGKFQPELRVALVHPISGPQTFGAALDRARKALAADEASKVSDDR